MLRALGFGLNPRTCRSEPGRTGLRDPSRESDPSCSGVSADVNAGPHCGTGGARAAGEEAAAEREPIRAEREGEGERGGAYTDG